MTVSESQLKAVMLVYFLDASLTTQCLFLAITALEDLLLLLMFVLINA